MRAPSRMQSALVATTFLNSQGGCLRELRLYVQSLALYKTGFLLSKSTSSKVRMIEGYHFNSCLQAKRGTSCRLRKTENDKLTKGWWLLDWKNILDTSDFRRQDTRANNTSSEPARWLQRNELGRIEFF